MIRDDFSTVGTEILFEEVGEAHGIIAFDVAKNGHLFFFQ